MLWDFKINVSLIRGFQVPTIYALIQKKKPLHIQSGSFEPHFETKLFHFHGEFSEKKTGKIYKYNQIKSPIKKSWIHP